MSQKLIIAYREGFNSGGVGEGDTVAPVLSDPVDTTTGSTTGLGTVTTDESNGTLYWVVTQFPNTPSAVQIGAGQDHTGSPADDSGSQVVASTGVLGVEGGFTGLSAGTTYYAHYVQVDAAANTSNVVSGDGFTTSASQAGQPLGLLLAITKAA